MAHEQFFTTAEDMQWVREVHCPDMPASILSVILTGNEDSPTCVVGWATAEPLNGQPADYERRWA